MAPFCTMELALQSLFFVLATLVFTAGAINGTSNVAAGNTTTSLNYTADATEADPIVYPLPPGIPVPSTVPPYSSYFPFTGNLPIGNYDNNLCGQYWSTVINAADVVIAWDVDNQGRTSFEPLCKNFFSDIAWEPWTYKDKSAPTKIDVVYFCIPVRLPGIAAARQYGPNDLKLFILGPVVLDTPEPVQIEMKLLNVKMEGTEDTLLSQGLLYWKTKKNKKGRMVPELHGVSCDGSMDAAGNSYEG